mgnify:CR=1 FL=1
MQPAADDRRRLLALHQQLEQALTAKDWGAMARVDQAIRAQLQVLAERPRLDDDVLRAKRRLKQLHIRALQACAEECERLRLRLLNHLQYAEGRLAYQRNELLWSGDGG